MNNIEIKEENLLTENNELDSEKLRKILLQNIPKIDIDSLKSKYDNNNGNNLYSLKINGKEYYLKSLPLNSKKQIVSTNKSVATVNDNIENIKRINKTRQVKPYILECRYIIVSNDTVLSVFEKFENSITLRELLKKISNTNEEYNYIIIRQIIVQLFKIFAELHNAGICHLNITPDNILLKKNPLANANETYTSESLFKIKLLNFNLNFKRGFARKIGNSSNLNPIDPFINEDSIISIQEAIKYDIWCLSLLILKLILKSELYYNHILEYKKNNLDNNSSLFLPINHDIIKNSDITDDKINNDIVDKLKHSKYLHIYNNIMKYGLVPLENRESCDFIINLIILDEKH